MQIMQGKETRNRNQTSRWGYSAPSVAGRLQLLQRVRIFLLFLVQFFGRGWAEAGLHIRHAKGSWFQSAEFLLAGQFGGKKKACAG